MTTESGFATERPPQGEVRPPLLDEIGPESGLEPTLRVRDLRVASVAYKEFRERESQGGSGNVDAWAASQPGLAVCMPYLGATTLQDVYADLKSLPKLPDSGKGLVSTLNAHRSTVRNSSRSKDSGGKESHRPSSGSSAAPLPVTLVPAQAD